MGPRMALPNQRGSVAGVEGIAGTSRGFGDWHRETASPATRASSTPGSSADLTRLSTRTTQRVPQRAPGFRQPNRARRLVNTISLADIGDSPRGAGAFQPDGSAPLARFALTLEHCKGPVRCFFGDGSNLFGGSPQFVRTRLTNDSVLWAMEHLPRRQLPARTPVDFRGNLQITSISLITRVDVSDPFRRHRPLRTWLPWMRDQLAIRDRSGASYGARRDRGHNDEST